MTQRRQIAIACSLAIPIFFAFLVFEIGALYRLDAHEGEIAKNAAALSECDSLLAAVRDAETAMQGYLTSGSDLHRSSFADATSRFSASLARLDELFKSDPAMESRLQSTRNLAEKKLALHEREMDSAKPPRLGKANSAHDTQSVNMTAEIDQIIASVRAEIQARSQQEQLSAARSASSVDTLVKYGGVVTIWIVGVAALLLFYDDSDRFRERIEQPLHTDILESLPLAVCLTTESGSILYANPAAESAFGYRSGELVARNIALLHDPNGGAEPNLAETLARLTPHELWSGELPIRIKNGDRIRAASWVASIRVGERDCRLLVHSAPSMGGLEQQTLLASQFRLPLGEAAGTGVPPRAILPGGPARTTPPDSEAVGAWHRAK